MPPLSNEQVELLAGKKLLGTITPDEQALLDQWISSQLAKPSTMYWNSGDSNETELKNRLLARIKDKAGIHQNTETPSKVRSIRWWRTAAAAVIITALAGSSYLMLNKKSDIKQVASNKINLEQIAPGHQGATLTLANGQQVLLDSAGDGQLAAQGAVQIHKHNGELIYTGSKGEDLVNTVSTDRGRQWSVVLPDGSKAWLNSASSLKYSLNFSGETREVTTTGEVYFEVAKDASRPFHVKTGDMDVTVLGTHFNINSYGDEGSTKVTLLEGSVRVSVLPGTSVPGLGTVTIKPGQQAQITDKIKIVNAVDLEQTMSWKTGFFEFRDLDLATIMRQISRWYNVDIRYEAQPGTEKFGGRISKNVDLATVLKGLEITGVKFRLDNNVLVVTP